MVEKAVIMDEESISRALKRISHEIIERNKNFGDVVIIGIQRRGVPIAKRISDIIYSTENIRVPVGILDITFYRDDLSQLAEHPVINGTQIDFCLNNKRIILIDDVLFTGRTVRAAIEACMESGRAKSIQLAVLVDRGHRELPIRADYVGKNVPTSLSEVVSVQLDEIDGVSKVTICEL